MSLLEAKRVADPIYNLADKVSEHVETTLTMRVAKLKGIIDAAIYFGQDRYLEPNQAFFEIYHLTGEEYKPTKKELSELKNREKDEK